MRKISIPTRSRHVIPTPCSYSLLYLLSIMIADQIFSSLSPDPYSSIQHDSSQPMLITKAFSSVALSATATTLWSCPHLISTRYNADGQVIAHELYKPCKSRVCTCRGRLCPGRTRLRAILDCLSTSPAEIAPSGASPRRLAWLHSRLHKRQKSAIAGASANEFEV